MLRFYLNFEYTANMKESYFFCTNRYCSCKLNDKIMNRLYTYKLLGFFFLGGGASLLSELFLAHLSQRLKWAIVIAHRPSVRRRRRPSSVVNFHIFDFFSRTAWWILMKLGMYEVLMVPYKCCCFSARSALGWNQSGAKISHGGPHLQETSSSDRKATGTNRMHSNDLEACGKKCCYFWFHSEVKFWRVLTSFWTVIFAYFNAISIDCYVVNCFICIDFV